MSKETNYTQPYDGTATISPRFGVHKVEMSVEFSADSFANQCIGPMVEYTPDAKPVALATSEVAVVQAPARAVGSAALAGAAA